MLTINTGKAVEWITIVGFILAAFTGGWNYVGKPWAQTLIEETVDGRLDDLEGKINQLLTATRAETAQSVDEAAATNEILCRLQAEQTGADPAQCSSRSRN